MKIKDKAKLINSKISAIYLAYKHKNTPWYAKFIMFFTIAYALSPIDLIPDFIPILGYVDDIIVLPLLICLCVKLIPNDVMSECTEKSKEIWKNGKPKKWVFAIPTIIFWLIVFGVLLWNILK